MLYLCLTTNFCPIYSTLFPTLRTTIKSWYILWISEKTLCAATYISSTLISSLLPAVRKFLNRLMKATKVGKLLFFCIFIKLFIVKSPSLQPISGVPPNGYFLWASDISKQCTFISHLRWIFVKYIIIAKAFWFLIRFFFYRTRMDQQWGYWWCLMPQCSYQNILDGTSSLAFLLVFIFNS